MDTNGLYFGCHSDIQVRDTKTGFSVINIQVQVKRQKDAVTEGIHVD